MPLLFVILKPFLDLLLCQTEASPCACFQSWTVLNDWFHFIWPGRLLITFIKTRVLLDFVDQARSCHNNWRLTDWREAHKICLLLLILISSRFFRPQNISVNNLWKRKNLVQGSFMQSFCYVDNAKHIAYAEVNIAKQKYCSIIHKEQA